MAISSVKMHYFAIHIKIWNFKMNKFIYLIAFINGFVMMSFEMIGAKILSPYFGNAMNTWGSIITVFMLFLAAGAWIGGSISQKTLNFKALILKLLGMILSMMVVLLFSQEILNFISNLAISFNSKLILSSIVLFSPFALCSGAIAPYSIQLLSNDQNSGKVAGKLYFISTIACGIGTLLTSFYLVVLLSIQNIILFNIILLFSSMIILILKTYCIQNFFFNSNTIQNQTY